MMIILTKTVASNVYGKVTRKTEMIDTFSESDFEKVVKVVEEKYIKPLGELTKRSISDGYAVWESRMEYEPSKWTGIKFKLEEEFEDS